MKLKHVATLLMLLSKCIMCVYSIKCHQCRSDLHQRCDLLKSDEYLLDCTKSAKRQLSRMKVPTEYPKEEQHNSDSYSDIYCRKITQALYFTKEYAYTTIRECAYTHENVEECYKSPWKDSKIVACDCRSEGCNQGYSNHKKIINFITFLLSFLSLFWWKFFLMNT